MHTVHTAVAIATSCLALFAAGCAGTQSASTSTTGKSTLDTTSEDWASRAAKESTKHAKAMLGTRAPDFTVKSIREGEPDFTLSEATNNGDVVLLAFWIRGCEHCTRSMPRMGELAEWIEEKDLPVSLVTVHNDMGWHPKSKSKMPSEESLADYSDALKFYAEGPADDFGSVYGTRSWPRAFVITPDGTIVHVKTNTGHDFVAELKEEVELALEVALEEPCGEMCGPRK
jgi:peroxiredoxin